jgi:hypothetical protein
VNIYLYSINQLYLIKEKNILITYSYKGTKYKKTLDNSAKKKKTKDVKSILKKIMSLISNKIKIKR